MGPATGELCRHGAGKERAFFGNLAQSRQRENLLNDERAPEQIAELDADHRHRRTEGILEGVLSHHHAWTEALRHGGSHVVLIQSVDECTAHLACDHG